MQIKDKIVVLDRDGVINVDSDDYIKSETEWIPIPGSIDAITRLSKAGYRVFVVTNQSGIGRGYFSIDTLNRMHAVLNHLLSTQGGTVEGIVYCPHLPTDNCACRKPRTGMLSQIERNYHVTLTGHYFVGDSLSDIECAANFGCRGVLVKTGKGEKTLAKGSALLESIPIFDDLSQFVSELLSGGIEN